MFFVEMHKECQWHAKKLFAHLYVFFASFAYRQAQVKTACYWQD